MRAIVFQTLTLFCLVTFAGISKADDRVSVTGGTIEGANTPDGIRVFKGIPFAAPPIGELRWRAPQPVPPWDGVRKADKFGAPPMQSAIAALVFGDRPSEDCLHLNVWTAAKDADERRPVMVWIYGGAFNGGGASDAMFDGTSFAKRGVVLVTFNYRIGVFGFLAHSELSAESGQGSGCYGIQDQIAALRWVKENIARFGGNPSNVTIFGQSAGGMSVSILAQSPLAKGLFQRAICQSGGVMAPIKINDNQPGAGLIASLTLAEEQGKAFFGSLGVKDIQSARALSADAVLKGNLGLPWPVADGETIVGNACELYQDGRFNDTPILVGITSNDGGLFGPQNKSPEEFEKSIRRDFADGAEAILAAYPHTTNEQAARSGRDLVRDTLFGWPSFAWAKAQSEKGKGRAYFYYFDYGGKPGEVGHGSEVPYVFGNLGGLLKPPASADNRAMSETIMSYWVNFAKHGDPNGPGLPRWPAFETGTMSAMTFRETPQAGPIPNLEKLTAFDAFYARLRMSRQE